MAQITIKDVIFKNIRNKALGTQISTILTQSTAEDYLEDYSLEQFLESNAYYKLISSLDIDWGNIQIDENKVIEDTADLINWIKSLSTKGQKVVFEQKNNNILTQNDFSKSNTIYVIQYDFSLNNQSITLPNNSILQFEGGSLSNGTLTGVNTQIIAPKTAIFDGITINGTWNVPDIYSAWFSDITADNSIKKLIALSNEDITNNIYIDDATYNVSVSSVNETVLNIKNNTNIYNNGTIKLAANAFDSYLIVGIYGKNVTFSGGKIIGDKATHTGSSGEWGHGIYISKAQDVIIENVDISYCWGDCIAISGDNNIVSKNIIVRNFTLTEGRRQGVSVIGVEGLLLENGYIADIYGTSPHKAIDIEPNNDTYVRNVIARNLTCVNYRDKGVISVTAATLEETYPSNILFENCYFEGKGIVFRSNQAKDVSLVGNTFKISPHACAIYTSKYTSRLTIKDNIIKDDGTDGGEADEDNSLFIAGSSNCVTGNYIDLSRSVIISRGDYINNIIKNISEFSPTNTCTIIGNTIETTSGTINLGGIVNNNTIKCKEMFFGEYSCVCRNNIITTNNFNGNMLEDYHFMDNIVYLNFIDAIDYGTGTLINIKHSNIHFDNNVFYITKESDSIGGLECLVYNRNTCLVKGNSFMDLSGSGITTHSLCNYIFKSISTADVTYDKNYGDSSLVELSIYNSINRFKNPVIIGHSRPTDIKQLSIGYRHFDGTLGIPVYVKELDSNTNTIVWVNSNGINMANVTAVIGTTSVRNTMSLSSENAGFEFFDIDLGKPVYWTGNSWVDSTGTVIN